MVLKSPTPEGSAERREEEWGGHPIQQATAIHPLGWKGKNPGQEGLKKPHSMEREPVVNHNLGDLFYYSLIIWQ